MSQRTLKVLVDTSALYPLLKELGKKVLPILDELTILDLTKYELGNALWKEYKQGRLENWEKTMEEWSKNHRGNSYIYY